MRPCHLTVCELCVRAHASCLRECADQAPVSGMPSAALLLCPDVWGWNGGRMRAIADSLAKEGYAVAVPKLLTPASNGGTDGDALSPTCEFSMDCTVCSPACVEPLFTSPVSVW